MRTPSKRAALRRARSRSHWNPCPAAVPPPQRHPPVLAGSLNASGGTPTETSSRKSFLPRPDVGAVAVHHERQIAEEPDAGEPGARVCHCASAIHWRYARKRRSRRARRGLRERLGIARAAPAATPSRRGRFARRGSRGIARSRRATTTRAASYPRNASRARRARAPLVVVEKRSNAVAARAFRARTSA